MFLGNRTMRKLLIPLLILLGLSTAKGQFVQNTPTKFSVSLGMPNVANPPLSQQGFLHFYPSVLKPAIHNGSVWQYLATEPWVLGNYAPLSRTITINGQTFDLTQNRSWTISGGGTGTVTSVGLSVPTGFSVSNTPITSSGVLALSFASGYSLPTDGSQSNWNTAFGWGNHAGRYPTYDGTGATGTWGVNITGQAANSVGWNSQVYNATPSTVNTYMMGLAANGNDWSPISQTNVRSFLGLGSNAYTSTTYQTPITLTTTGTSGAATFNGTTLNIPQYTQPSGSYVDLTTNQTAAGNKTWTGDIQTFSGIGVRFDQNAYYKHRSSVNQLAGYGVLSTGSDNSWRFNSASGVTRSFQLFPPDNGTAYAQFRNEDNSITPRFVSYTVQNVDQEITDPTKGIILSSPNGTRWRVTVSNAGALVVTSL